MNTTPKIQDTKVQKKTKYQHTLFTMTMEWI